MTAFTLDQVQAKAREVIDEVGADHVYQSDPPDGACLYVKNGKPDCIVGRILAKLGVPLEFLADHNRNSKSFVFLVEALKEAGYQFTPEATTFLDVLQDAQDGNARWGNAYEQARELAEEE